MRLFLYLCLGVFLFLGGLYLLNQAFPGFFGDSYTFMPEATQVNDTSLETTQVGEEYIKQLCGDECGICNKSYDKCVSVLEEQVGVICLKGGRQEEVCFYDLEELTSVCKKLCS